jgi:predicted transporter
MVDESIEKRRRVSVFPAAVAWVAGLVLQVVGRVVETPDSKALGRSLEIVGIVFLIAGLILMRRYRTKESKWRETGKWE